MKVASQKGNKKGKGDSFTNDKMTLNHIFCLAYQPIQIATL